jgi:hypothetical protein
MLKSFKARLTNFYVSASLMIIGYALIAAYFILVLEYKFLQSDVLGYWQDSLNWREPFHPYHVPGYPLLIALMRGILFISTSPVLLMMAINFLAYIASMFLIYQIMFISGVGEKYSTCAVYAFALWPFVGLVYVVDPLADMPVMTLFLLGIYSLIKSQVCLSFMVLGLSIVTHKGIWPFALLIIVAYLIRQKPALSKHLIMALLLMFLPISILLISGSFYHHSLFWLLSSNLETEIKSHGNLPIFDGILGTFSQGGFKALFKGGLILILTFTSAALIYINYRTKPMFFQYGMVISIAVLTLFVLLNRYEIWAAVRFSRLLILPIIWLMGYRSNLSKSPVLSWPIIATLALMSLASQFAYAWYMAKVYFQ